MGLNAFSLSSFSGDIQNAQRLSVDTTIFIPFSRRRYTCVFIWIHFRELFHIDVVSPKMLSVLVWTEDLKASKCSRLKPHWCGQGLRSRPKQFVSTKLMAVLLETLSGLRPRRHVAGYFRKRRCFYLNTATVHT